MVGVVVVAVVACATHPNPTIEHLRIDRMIAGQIERLHRATAKSGDEQVRDRSAQMDASSSGEASALMLLLLLCSLWLIPAASAWMAKARSSTSHLA